jgi:hypothetical protein
MGRIRNILLICTAIIFLAIGICGASGSMRCGNSYVKAGDRTFQVQERCGAPKSKQTVGYTIDDNKKRELLIEEWVYGPEGGYYFTITFIGGQVSQVSSQRQ